MIDEKKLIKRFKAYQGADTLASMFISDVIKEIKHQAKEGSWIPAEEPPEDGGYVLLSFANFSIPLVGRYEEDEEGGAYYVGDDTESCISQDMVVNAWQPLPEPYQP